ncbi:hypothetical protein GCM10009665_25210 [Kitasatospora nipponensis]|uniref:Uncharacterized protein n=1 Tax=Kitasatospora nipponensis TaxID=258049 RepID=A0ABN1W903_9ACTN
MSGHVDPAGDGHRLPDPDEVALGSGIQVRGKFLISICPVVSVSVRVAHSEPARLACRRAWVMVPTSRTSPSLLPEVRRAAMVGLVGIGAERTA